jgi:hypothetical protein
MVVEASQVVRINLVAVVVAPHLLRVADPTETNLV